jgi:hypothetical protein
LEQSCLRLRMSVPDCPGGSPAQACGCAARRQAAGNRSPGSKLRPTQASTSSSHGPSKRTSSSAQVRGKPHLGGRERCEPLFHRESYPPVAARLVSRRSERAEPGGREPASTFWLPRLPTRRTKAPRRRALRARQRPSQGGRSMPDHPNATFVRDALKRWRPAACRTRQTFWPKTSSGTRSAATSRSAARKPSWPASARCPRAAV